MPDPIEPSFWPAPEPICLFKKKGRRLVWIQGAEIAGTRDHFWLIAEWDAGLQGWYCEGSRVPDDTPALPMPPRIRQ